MGGSSGGGDTKTTQEPWGGQKPYLRSLYERAEDLPLQQPYPGQTFVPWSPESIAGLEAMEQRAMGGSPILGSAQAENLRTTSGGYLDIANDPGFQAAYQAAARNIIPQVQGQAVGAGRYGGGLSQLEQTKQLGEAFASQWAPLYSAERERMLRSSMMSPSLAAADYSDIDRLMQVGAMQEAKSGEELQDAMSRWAFEQQAPYTQLTTMAPVIGGTSYGGITTQSSQGGMSPIGAALGGGLAGAYLGGPSGITGLGLSPLGGLGIGAGLGLLASMV